MTGDFFKKDLQNVNIYAILKKLYAPVAQLDRVSDSDYEGRAFESHRAYHVGTDFAPFRFFF